MNILATAVIAILMALAGLHVYWGLGGLWPGTTEADLLARVRGIASYAPGVFSYAIGTPFHDLNRHYYAPLCLAIAAAMAISYGRGSQPG